MSTATLINISPIDYNARSSPCIITILRLSCNVRRLGWEMSVNDASILLFAIMYSQRKHYQYIVVHVISQQAHFTTTLHYVQIRLMRRKWRLNWIRSRFVNVPQTLKEQVWFWIEDLVKLWEALKLLICLCVLQQLSSLHWMPRVLANLNHFLSQWYTLPLRQNVALFGNMATKYDNIPKELIAQQWSEISQCTCSDFDF